MSKTAELIIDGKSYTFPIIEGTENELAIDISSLRDQTGIITIDADRLGFEAAALMIEYGIRHVVVSGLPDPGTVATSTAATYAYDTDEHADPLNWETRSWRLR